MTLVLDIILNPTGRGVYEAEGRDGEGAVGVGLPGSLAFGPDL